MLDIQECLIILPANATNSLLNARLFPTFLQVTTIKCQSLVYLSGIVKFSMSTDLFSKDFTSNRWHSLKSQFFSNIFKFLLFMVLSYSWWDTWHMWQHTTFSRRGNCVQSRLPNAVLAFTRMYERAQFRTFIFYWNLSSWHKFEWNSAASWL